MRNLDFCYTSAVKTWFYRIEQFRICVKIRWKIDAESMPQKVETSMLKWLPKWVKIGPKMTPGATFGHWLCDFWPFGAAPKNKGFLIPLWRLQKTEKLAQDAAKWAKRVSGTWARAWFRSQGAPGRPRARQILGTGRLANWKVGKLASGKRESWQVMKGTRLV